MQLGVFDRVILLNILPKEGDFTTLKIVRKLREDLSFDDPENSALKFCTPAKCNKCGKITDVPFGKEPPPCDCGGKLTGEGNIKWKAEADIPKEIPIGEKAIDIIKDVLKKLDKDKKLSEQHYNIYEKFVES